MKIIIPDAPPTKLPTTLFTIFPSGKNDSMMSIEMNVIDIHFLMVFFVLKNSFVVEATFLIDLMMISIAMLKKSLNLRLAMIGIWLICWTD